MKQVSTSQSTGLATGLGTSGELALSLDAELLGCADVALGEIESLDRAGPASLSFIRDQKYLSLWAKSACGAALVTRGVIECDGGPDVPAGRALIVVDDADQAMVTILGRFSEQTAVAMGIDESASIDASAAIGEGVAIAPGVVIGPGSCIGDRCEIRSGCMIGARVKIGADCLLHPNVVVQDRCELGERCIMQPGVVIGGDGFGYVPALDGKGLMKIPHIGNVVIGSDVEIGANSCVDRAKFGSTLIGDGTKIDNLVQIGHGCSIGRACIVCGLVGLAGSVKVGDGVVFAGHAGVTDNTTIGDGATIAAMTGVTKNVPAGETWLGFPARPSKERMQQWAALEKLPDMMRDIRRMLKTDSAGR